MANSNKNNTLDTVTALRKVTDDVDESLRITPSSSTGFAIELSAVDGDTIAVQPTSAGVATGLDAISAGANNASAAISLASYSKYSVQIVWSGLTGTLDGVVKVQGSLDDTAYTDISGVTVTLSAAAGNAIFNVADAAYLFIKIIYTANLVTAGTITAKYNLKG